MLQKLGSVPTPRAVSFNRGIGSQDLLEGHLGEIHRGCRERHVKGMCGCGCRDGNSKN